MDVVILVLLYFPNIYFKLLFIILEAAHENPNLNINFFKTRMTTPEAQHITHRKKPVLIQQISIGFEALSAKK